MLMVLHKNALFQNDIQQLFFFQYIQQCPGNKIRVKFKSTKF